MANEGLFSCAFHVLVFFKILKHRQRKGVLRGGRFVGRSEYMKDRRTDKEVREYIALYCIQTII